MDYKYWSWFIVCLCVLLNILGSYMLFLLSITFSFFIVGIITIIYLQHGNEEEFLNGRRFNDTTQQDPLDQSKLLGLNLAFDQKPIILLSPDIRVQTELKKLKNPITSDIRKKSIIDSGIELLFKKNSKNIKDGVVQQHHAIDTNYNKHHTEITAGIGGAVEKLGNFYHGDDNSKWNLFDTIKIHTDKKRTSDTKVDVHLAEECSFTQAPERNPIYKLHTDAAILDQHGSPKKKLRTMLSGHKQIDQLLHTIINYILRDFIDSWFFSLTDNKEFSEYRTRNCIEESVQNVCTRIKNTQWVPLITTKLVDIVALHARYYRLANETVNLALDDISQQSAAQQPLLISSGQLNEKLSPQRRPNVNRKIQQHRRNKSDTELSWHLTNQSVPRNLGNSKFYDNDAKLNDKPKVIDPETKLINAFFNQCDLYRNECMNEAALEKYLTHCMETCLYFTLPEEDFACLPLRTFLSTLLANVVCKPIIEMLSEPDFINLQIAKLFSKEPPSSELFLKLIRQCNDLAELRACRQLITKEMDSKFKDSSAAAELNSLKYTQKLIDLRISFLQNNKLESDRDKPVSNLPILTLDELLSKELALSYYLDYLSILNLQKYVIFYLMAREWKTTTNRCLTEANKSKSARGESIRMLRDKANNLYKEYLSSSSPNFLNIDSGLIETLNIRLGDPSITLDASWLESICKFVYEKIKNEDIFLNNFYQSSAYRKLLLELELNSNLNVDSELDTNLSSTLSQTDTGSDSNSGDIQFDDEIDFVLDSCTLPTSSGNNNSMATSSLINVPVIPTILPKHNHNQHVSSASLTAPKSDKHLPTETLIETTLDISFAPLANTHAKLLDVCATKHSRSHSDCTGIVQNMQDINIEPLTQIGLRNDTQPKTIKQIANKPERATTPNSPPELHSAGNNETITANYQQRLSAKIINTAINCEGQFAVYAIHVTVIEDNQQKSWHVYRRYSKFLDLKKILVKRYPSIAQVPFPAKKAFQNTQRSVLEHRMTVLNDFLKIVCSRADDNEDLHFILRDFLEPDTNDKKIHGGAVIRTIETIVNPLKSGMRTIKNMPDSLVGGVAKILLGKGSAKETAFLDITPIHLEHSSEYPALTSALNLLDEVFDLQARSQWLRRGLINRLLGAPWVSQAANKRITQATRAAIEVDKIENLLSVILNTIWPDGKRLNQSIPREENTKLRTRMAAKIALFALLSDDLKHVVGSETTRFGLLNCFSMWQHKTLNMRLVLVLFNEILTTLYQTDDLTKHTK